MTAEKLKTATSLTPEQSADVVEYYHKGENREFTNRGWKPKVSFGLAAIHAAQSKHSILPDGAPLLSVEEMGIGIEVSLDRNKKSEPSLEEMRERDWRERQFKD